MLISNAYAQAASGGAAPGGEINMIFMLIAFGFLMYFMVIRPQSKRMKEHKAMIETLQKGDEVVTQGGVVGKITKTGENYFSVEISENVEIAVQKTAIAQTLPKGTLKAL